MLTAEHFDSFAANFLLARANDVVNFVTLGHQSAGNINRELPLVEPY